MKQNKKRKLIPPFLMLLAGAITSIITYFVSYEVVDALWILLGVLVLFFVLGSFIKKLLDAFETANLKKLEEEGEVFKKETEEESEEDSSADKDVE